MSSNKMKSPQPLTPKEKVMLEYIESFVKEQGFSPTFTEIKDHFGYASYNSVQRYLKQLEKKNYVHLPGGNQKRAIQVLYSSSIIKNQVLNLPPRVESSKTNSKIVPLGERLHSSSKETPREAVESLSIPFLGGVAAGVPLEAEYSNESVDVPLSLVREPSKTFALKVCGQSMIEDGILDGDTVLVKSQSTVQKGDIAVVVVDNEATIKRVYFHPKKGALSVELRPSNKEMSSMWYAPEDIQIKGKLVGLIRQF